MNLSHAVLFATLATGCATEERARQLDERVAALEKKVEELEKKPSARPTGKASDAPPAAPVDPVKEEAAGKIFEKVNAAMGEGDMATAKVHMAELQGAYASTNVAQKAKRYAAELDVVGKAAPPQLAIEKWFQGETSLNLTGSKPTLVVFWEAWCGYCRKELPVLETDVWQKYKGKGLQVVALTRITKSATEEKVLEFVKENKISYPVAKDSGASATYFAVSGIPAAAVIKDGKVVWRGNPSRLNDEMINRWL